MEYPRKGDSRQELDHLNLLYMAYIAAGRLEGYIVTGAKSWDMAGGIAILEEAGGKITNYKGEPYTLDSFEWLASNGHLHDNFVDIYK